MKPQQPPTIFGKNMVNKGSLWIAPYVEIGMWIPKRFVVTIEAYPRTWSTVTETKSLHSAARAAERAIMRLKKHVEKMTP